MLGKLRIIMALLLLQSGISYAGKESAKLYKGTLDKMQVTLYLKTMANECGGYDIYMAMYKYDKKSEWLQLDIHSNEKSDWCMTEIGFTGVMVLKSGEKVMNGIWISPDGKKQLKVSLIQQPLSETERKKMEDKLEQVNYENFDC
jgi:hypothetical protein